MFQVRCPKTHFGDAIVHITIKVLIIVIILLNTTACGIPNNVEILKLLLFS